MRSVTSRSPSSTGPVGCPSYHESNESCSGTEVDATVIDGAVLGELGHLVPAFDEWIDRVTSRQDAERARLEQLRDRAVRDLHDQAHKAAAVEAKGSAYVAESDEAKAELVLPMVERERQNHAAAQVRAQATQDALDTVPTGRPLSMPCSTSVRPSSGRSRPPER